MTDYKYWKDIYNPDILNMRSEGTIGALEDDIEGIVGYVTLLTSGGGGASKVNGALGKRYFQKSIATCKADDTGETVPRYLYVNFVPDGSIPFIPSSSGPGLGFKGLIPGAMTNIAALGFENMVEDLIGGSNPSCKKVCLKTGYTTSDSYECQYLTENDIASINPSLVVNNVEGFSPIPSNNIFSLLKHLNLKTADNLLYKVYFYLLGAFSVYLLYQGYKKLRSTKSK